MTGPGRRMKSPKVSNPFVGPRPFRQVDAGSFFGRDQKVAEIRSRWLEHRVTVLYGPPATGKTSLLQGGVLPLLGELDQLDVLQPGRLSQQSSWPQRPATSAANAFRVALLRSWAPLSAAPPLSVANFMRSRLRQRTDSGKQQLIMAAVDHVEELFADTRTGRASQDLIAELASAVREVPQLRLLLIVRDDYLDELTACEPQFSPDAFSYCALPAFTPEEALEAMTRPLEGTEISFAEDAAAECVSSLRTVTYAGEAGDPRTALRDRVEPLFLQITCAELVSARPAGTRTITRDGIRESGGVDTVLADFCDSVIEEVELETETPASRLRSWLESTFITEQGGARSINRDISLTAGMPNEVADSFALHHLLTAEHRTHGARYRLFHDRLLAPVQQANRRWQAGQGTQTDRAPEKQASPAAFAAAAEAALVEGNFPSARRFAGLAATRYRQAGNERRFARAMMLQGDIARRSGDLGGAGESFRTALSTFALLDDRNATVRILSELADVHFSVGDYGTAADLQQQAIGRLPSDVSALIGLGYAQWYGGSPANAEATFSRAVNWDPDATLAIAGRGQVRAEMQEYAHALRDLDDALAAGVPPADEPDVRSARALALAALGRIEEAEQDLAAARAKDPGRARTMLRAGRIAALRGQPELAHQELDHALNARSRLSPWEDAAARRLLASLARAGHT
jgi:tetratricopeptide (TPR) repeat protein